MSSLKDIHNASFKRAVDEIVKPTIEAGGSTSAVMVVLETTVVATLLACAKLDGQSPRHYAALLETGLVPAVIERLAKYANENGG